MVALNLKAFIGEDRRLVIDLPKDTPTGSVEIMIQSEPEQPTIATELPLTNSAREIARAKLLSAGYLVTDFNFQIPEDYVPLTHQERMQLTAPMPGAKTILELINEDRGEW